MDAMDDSHSSKTKPYYGFILVKKSNGSICGSFPVTKKEITFGRDKHCDIRIYLPNVSAQHCTIYYINNKAYIRDKSVCTSTTVNGKKIGKSNFLLQQSDEIEISNRKFVWEYFKSQSELITESKHKFKNDLKSPRFSRHIPNQHNLKGSMTPSNIKKTPSKTFISMNKTPIVEADMHMSMSSYDKLKNRLNSKISQSNKTPLIQSDINSLVPGVNIPLPLVSESNLTPRKSWNLCHTFDNLSTDSSMIMDKLSNERLKMDSTPEYNCSYHYEDDHVEFYSPINPTFMLNSENLVKSLVKNTAVIDPNNLASPSELDNNQIDDNLQSSSVKFNNVLPDCAPELNSSRRDTYSIDNESTTVEKNTTPAPRRSILKCSTTIKRFKPSSRMVQFARLPKTDSRINKLSNNRFQSSFTVTDDETNQIEVSHDSKILQNDVDEYDDDLDGVQPLDISVSSLINSPILDNSSVSKSSNRRSRGNKVMSLINSFEKRTNESPKHSIRASDLLNMSGNTSCNDSQNGTNILQESISSARRVNLEDIFQSEDSLKSDTNEFVNETKMHEVHESLNSENVLREINTEKVLNNVMDKNKSNNSVENEYHFASPFKFPLADSITVTEHDNLSSSTFIDTKKDENISETVTESKETDTIKFNLSHNIEIECETSRNKHSITSFDKVDDMTHSLLNDIQKNSDTDECVSLDKVETITLNVLENNHINTPSVSKLIEKPTTVRKDDLNVQNNSLKLCDGTDENSIIQSNNCTDINNVNIHSNDLELHEDDKNVKNNVIELIDDDDDYDDDDDDDDILIIENNDIHKNSVKEQNDAIECIDISDDSLQLVNSPDEDDIQNNDLLSIDVHEGVKLHNSNEESIDILDDNNDLQSVNGSNEELIQNEDLESSDGTDKDNIATQSNNDSESVNQHKDYSQNNDKQSINSSDSRSINILNNVLVSNDGSDKNNVNIQNTDLKSLENATDIKKDCVGKLDDLIFTEEVTDEGSPSLVVHCMSKMYHPNVDNHEVTNSMRKKNLLVNQQDEQNSPSKTQIDSIEVQFNQIHSDNIKENPNVENLMSNAYNTQSEKTSSTIDEINGSVSKTKFSAEGIVDSNCSNYADNNPIKNNSHNSLLKQNIDIITRAVLTKSNKPVKSSKTRSSRRIVKANALLSSNDDDTEEIDETLVKKEHGYFENTLNTSIGKPKHESTPWHCPKNSKTAYNPTTSAQHNIESANSENKCNERKISNSSNSSSSSNYSMPDPDVWAQMLRDFNESVRKVSSTNYKVTVPLSTSRILFTDKPEKCIAGVTITTEEGLSSNNSQNNKESSTLEMEKDNTIQCPKISSCSPNKTLEVPSKSARSKRSTRNEIQFQNIVTEDDNCSSNRINSICSNGDKQPETIPILQTRSSVAIKRKQPVSPPIKNKNKKKKNSPMLKVNSIRSTRTRKLLEQSEHDTMLKANSIRSTRSKKLPEASEYDTYSSSSKHQSVSDKVKKISRNKKKTNSPSLLATKNLRVRWNESIDSTQRNKKLKINIEGSSSSSDTELDSQKFLNVMRTSERELRKKHKAQAETSKKNTPPTIKRIMRNNSSLIESSLSKSEKTVETIRPTRSKSTKIIQSTKNFSSKSITSDSSLDYEIKDNLKTSQLNKVLPKTRNSKKVVQSSSKSDKTSSPTIKKSSRDEKIVETKRPTRSKSVKLIQSTQNFPIASDFSDYEMKDNPKTSQLNKELPKTRTIKKAVQINNSSSKKGNTKETPVETSSDSSLSKKRGRKRIACLKTSKSTPNRSDSSQYETDESQSSQPIKELSKTKKQNIKKAVQINNNSSSKSNKKDKTVVSSSVPPQPSKPLNRKRAADTLIAQPNSKGSKRDELSKVASTTISHGPNSPQNVSPEIIVTRNKLKLTNTKVKLDKHIETLTSKGKKIRSTKQANDQSNAYQVYYSPRKLRVRGKK